MVQNMFMLNNVSNVPSNKTDLAEQSVGSTAYRQPASEAINWTFPGFLGNVRVLTDVGALPIDRLHVNDPIVTTTGRTLHVARISKIGLDRDFLIRHPEAQPILIPKDAFSRGFPKQDMLVSPGQEMTVPSGDLQNERVRASEIIGTNSVVRAPQGLLNYYVLELGEPAYIYAEGVPVFVPNKQTSH